MRDAIDHALEQDDDVDIIMTGPPPGGDGSDLEDVDDDQIEYAGMPDEVSGVLETMQQEAASAETFHESQKSFKLRKKNIHLPFL